MMRRNWLLDSLVLCLLVTALIWPLFKLKYLERWGSIESTFIADAQMQHSTPGLWQPYWYTGTRWVYIYPPFLRQGTAILSKAIHSTEARAYHLYTAFHYVIGILAVYFLVRIGTRRRLAAWLAAGGTALLSPILLFFEDIRIDSVFGIPQRLHVLTTYGEGPHISALCLLPFVFAAWFARRYVLAAIAAAFVVSNNFYGATALAILFPIAVWATVTRERTWRPVLRAVGVAALAYGLTAWWLVPSYLKVTQDNLKLVADPGNLPSFLATAILVPLFGWLTWRYFRKASEYRIFVFGSLFFLSLYVLGHRWLGFQVAGQSMRLIPELDMVFVLAFVEILFLVPRFVAIPLAVAAFATSIPYLQNGWKFEFRKDNAWESRAEYSVAKWMWENQRDSRAFVTGSHRFWYNVWHSMPQLDGGSQQGLLNQRILVPIYHAIHMDDVPYIGRWLDAMGTDVAIISEKNSTEHYHDIAKPEAWRASGFPILHDDGKGNVIYRIPRPRPGIVHILKTADLERVPPNRIEQHDPPAEYLNALHSSRPPARFDRISNDEVRITGPFQPGESVIFQETYDPYWTADKSTVRRDPIGFMRLDFPSSVDSVTLRFEMPLEMKIGRIVSILSVLTALILLFRRPTPIMDISPQ